MCVCWIHFLWIVAKTCRNVHSKPLVSRCLYGAAIVPIVRKRQAFTSNPAFTTLFRSEFLGQFRWMCSFACRAHTHTHTHKRKTTRTGSKKQKSPGIVCERSAKKPPTKWQRKASREIDGCEIGSGKLSKHSPGPSARLYLWMMLMETHYGEGRERKKKERHCTFPAGWELRFGNETEPSCPAVVAPPEVSHHPWNGLLFPFGFPRSAVVSLLAALMRSFNSISTYFWSNLKFLKQSNKKKTSRKFLPGTPSHDDVF